MPVRVFSTKEFDRFARKAKIADAALVGAIERAERGLVGADLGGGVFKMRVACPGEGKSGGYRTIVCFVVEARAFFIYGFAKNDLDNIGETALGALRNRATAFQSASEETIRTLLNQNQLREIER